MKLAVFFPGVGYTCEKPLLYFSQEICRELGYEIVKVPYDNLGTNIKGDLDKMKAALASALKQTEDMLKEITWSAYDEVVFISKSIGTIVAAAYAKKYKLKVRNVFYTPMIYTFDHMDDVCVGIMFHGTADPWVESSDALQKAAEKMQIPMILIPEANHSLETGDVQTDLVNMQKLMEDTIAYIGGN